jgi:hypothetical protein
MKKWLVLALVVALALAVVPLALAGGGGEKAGKARGKAKFNLVGKVVAADAEAATLTVHVKSGTKTVRAYRGADLALVVDSDARVRLVTAEGVAVVTLADLPVGAKVKVRGTIDRSDPAAPMYRARFVQAKGAPAPEPTAEPSPSATATP